MDSLKYFEISVARHIRVAELRKKIIRLTTFYKYICNWTLEVRDILKIVWKRGEISPLFHNIFYLLLDFHVWAGTRFSLRDKRLFEIAKVNCMLKYVSTPLMCKYLAKSIVICFLPLNDLCIIVYSTK